ncbi:hypothetical protein B5M09_004249 [Aphanomyces astaci]|uniref:histidinol-phosphate transaminase n=1 Tax=Aphanomyces astaci TaxID=112090 RepID=A0A3R7XTK6_APHAT|nr:hypothetical protein B5M09_004249 [Aphanomyces astaci]
MTKLPVELFATFGVGLGVGLLLHKYALAASSKDAITSTKGLSIEDQQDEVRRLVRPNILKLTPYRCARDDYSEGTLLDANENSLGPPLHDDHLLRDEGLERYPCPYQIDLKTAVANLRYSLSPLSSQNYNGFVVVDEAYIDFTGSSESSLAPLVTKYRRLVVTQTLSKGFGLAGIRLGIAFGDPELIQILSNVKAPYNINKLSSKVALDALANVDRLHANVRVILDEKQKVIDALQASPYVKAVYASDSNFVLFECANAYQVYRKMAENGVVIRYRGNQHLLNDCLRATIGSPEENHRMLTMFASVSAEVQQA